MKLNKKFLLSLAIASSLCLQSHADKLVILHTNDTHSQIDPFADNTAGVVRRKALIDSVRNTNDNVLLIDAGDMVQGSLFFNLYKGEVEELVSNAIGYDMRILGNHEFDNGMEKLAQNLSMSEAELLNSNYNFRGTPLEGMFKPYAIREVGGKRIAFMPINLQPKGMIAASNYEGMGYADQFETALHLAWYLKNIENADAVVAITHIGYDDDVELIRQSRDIDLLIGGHSHTTINPANEKSVPHIIKNAEGRDILVAQAGKGASNVGVIVIDTDNLQELPSYRLIKVDSRFDDRTDPAMEAMLQPYRAAIEALDQNYVSKTNKGLEKGSDALLNFVSDFVLWQGQQLADNIDLAIMNKGGIRNDLPKGKVSQGDIIRIMPFFNRVQVIEISGDSLITAFNTMAKVGGNGVSQNVKATFAPDTRICDEILISGKPIDPNATYRIATIDYLANGGDYMHSLVDHKNVAASKNILYEDMLYYLTEGPYKGKSINPKEEKRMKRNTK